MKKFIKKLEKAVKKFKNDKKIQKAVKKIKKVVTVTEQVIPFVAPLQMAVPFVSNFLKWNNTILK